MKEIVLGIWLLIQAGVDFRHKEISVKLSLVGIVMGLVFCVFEKRGLPSLLIALLPGLFSLGFSWMTKEVIGYGDGIVFLTMGTYLPISRVIGISLAAFFIAGVVAIILLTIFHKKGRYRMPFVPFLTLAYGWEWMTRLGEL